MQHQRLEHSDKCHHHLLYVYLLCICNCICVCNCICICFCICICIRIGRCIRLLLLYDSRHDIHNHYRRRHHNYCNQHFARSTKAQEVSAIPTPRTLKIATWKMLPGPQSQ